MDRSWLEEWRQGVVEAVNWVMVTFEQHAPYPPDDNRVGPPASAADLAILTNLVPPAHPDLLLFYEIIGEISLPDIANAYFIHDPRLVASHASQAPRLSPPYDTDIQIFGSDGGGTLYAVPAGLAMPVFRLREAGITNGAYDASRVEVIAGDFRRFLDALSQAIQVFARNGEIADM